MLNVVTKNIQYQDIKTTFQQNLTCIFISVRAESIQNINFAIIEDDYDSELYYYKGMILYDLGNKNLACDNWNYAVKLGDNEWGEKLLKLCN